MECPRCAYHNQADTVQCPQCHDTFQVAELEEIGHLQYTQDRLDRWWADGTLPSRVAQRLLSLAAADEDFLLERINLRNALPQPATIGATAPLVPSRTANVSVATLATGSPAASISVPAPSISEVIEHERERRRCSVAVAPQVSMALGGPAPAGATVPLGLRPAPNPRAALALPVAPPPPPKPARAPRPTFSWKQVGIYLLSERTLNALLGLGAFLILAAACVISTVNPTGLGPLPHLAAMICTTLVFYGAGAFVQQRMKLMRTGAALLAIGAAFIPLDVWTLGRDILELEPRPIWVLASVLCLPIYLASHLWLRDRSFALLTAVTGASLVVSLAHPLGIAPIWGGCALVGLSGVYLLLAHRLRLNWEQLCWALFWTAQVAVPVAMATLLGLRFSPQASSGFLPNSWLSTLGATPGASLDYAVGTAWWLGAAFYALGARLFSRRAYAFAAAWTLPCAYLFTLTKAPFEAAWYGLCLAALGGGYLAFGRVVQRLLTGVARPSLTQLLNQPAYQVGLALSLLAGVWPLSATGRFSSPSEASTLWLLVGFYAAAGIAFRHIAFRYAAAYLIPVALLATPEQHLTWWPNLPSVGIAALAACYLLFGRFALGITRLGDRRASYLALGREPIFQVAGLLTLAAALWPALPLQPTFITAAAISTLAAVALTYGAAAFLLGQRAWSYLAVYLLPVTYGLTLAKLDLSPGATLLGWALLALALLLAAEAAARRTAEGGRSLAETVIGRGTWRSRFASPLFSACYAVSALAVALGLNQAGNLSAISAQGIAGLLLVCALYAGSSAARRTSLFLYAATWLFLLPFSTIAAHAYAHVGIALTIPLEARLLALLSLGYLALAFLADRARGHYAKPVYLAAYLLAALAIALAIPSTSITVQTLGIGLLGLVWSAWLVHRGRHPSYAWVVGQMAADAPAQVIEVAEMLFQYLAVWLFPVWLLLLQSLRHPAPSPADFGMCLALLAPLYVAVSLRFARIHAAYRLPWLLGGYALSVLGPLVALPDPLLRMAALTVSITLYVASALHSRRHEWLWLAAALGPALLLEALYRFGDPARFYGIALVCLSLAYGFLGLIIQRGGIRDLFAPLYDRPLPFALPFIGIGQLLCLAGLGLVIATQDLGLALIGFSLGALYYGYTAAISRRGVCSIPLATTLAVVYVAGMQFSPLPSRWYGAGLLPGLTAFLAIGEIFRRTADAAGMVAERRKGSLYNTWAMPFNAILHLGALAAFFLSALAGGDQPLAWWAISALYFALSALRRRPGPLYPAIGLALASYLGTGSLLAHDPSLADTLFSLVPPVWLLFSLAYGLGRLLPSTGATAPRRLRWSGPAGAQPWARPLLFWGAATLVFSMVASGSDALIKSTAADLGTALAYLALLGTLSLLWRSRPLVWATIAIVAMACQETLELAGVSPSNQPACWVVAALAACLLGRGLGRLANSRAQLWAAPLTQVAYAGSVLALCVAAGNLTLGRFALQPLAVTLAVISAILLIQGIAGRKPTLYYLGIGLLTGGYVCELLFRQVAQPQAFALPMGLTLLLAAFLEWRRGAARTKDLLEIAAILLLLGTTLVQGCGGLGAGADRYNYDTFLLLESVALFGLSAALHWKRTFFAACGALVADVFILMADPLRAVNTWYLIASIGCAMIGLVIFLEQRRQQIPLWIDDVRLRLEAWD